MPTKVLVFESDSAFAHELQSGLAAYGCEVTVVDDATLGLQAAAGNKPDLVLLAIELPKMNGFSVCNKLKRDAALKNVPLIIMSSDSTEETFEQHRRLRTRAEDYLHKPIGVAELVEKIRPFIPLTGPAESTGLTPEEELLLDQDPLSDEAPALEVSEAELDEALDAELLDEELVEIDVAPPSEAPGFDAEERPSVVDADVEDFADSAFDAILETPAEAAQHLEPPHAAPSNLELESAPDLDAGAAGQISSGQTLHSQVSYEEAVAQQEKEDLELGAVDAEELDAALSAGQPSAPASLLDGGDATLISSSQEMAVASLEAAGSQSAPAGTDEQHQEAGEAPPNVEAADVEEALEAFEDAAPLEDFDPVVEALPPPSKVPEIPGSATGARPITSSPPRGSSFPPRPSASIPITFDQERSRLEGRIAELEGELGKVRSRAQQLDDTLQRGLAKDAEVQKLRRELDDAKAKQSSGPGAGSAREFLDLREQLNRKDKEILDIRDELSHKEKELLGLRDTLLSLEREKADNADRAAELEKRATELERAAEAFKNDKEQANKRADDFKRKAEKLKADYDAKASEFAELRTSIDSELRKKDEEHALSLEQLDAQYSAQLAELGERRQAALAEAQQSFEATLNEALGKAKLASDEELAAQKQLLTQQAKDELANLEAALKAQSQAELSEQQSAHEQSAAELRAEHERALYELRAAHEQALADLEKRHGEAMSQANAEHAQALTTNAEQYQAQLRQAQADAEATLSQQKAEWDSILATRLATLSDENAQALLALEQAVATAEASRDAEKHAHEQTRAEREREQAAANENIHQLTQKLAELEAAYAKERGDSETLRTELSSVQELLHDTSIRLARDADSARTQAAIEIEQAQRKAKEDTERLQAELGAELTAAQNRAAELSHERDHLRAELAATRESLGTELGETRAALKDEQERNRNAISKWEQDRGSLERAKDALAAALAQIEETEGRPLS